jgi:retinol dehydrogenase-12
MNPPIKALTADGYDLQWGTNVLGYAQSSYKYRLDQPDAYIRRPFYLSQLLLPLLTEGAKTSPDGHVRIVHTASSTSEGGSIKMDTFRDGPARKQLGGIRLYAQSKLVS